MYDFKRDKWHFLYTKAFREAKKMDETSIVFNVKKFTNQ